LRIFRFKDLRMKDMAWKFFLIFSCAALAWPPAVQAKEKKPEFTVRLSYNFSECRGYCEGEMTVEGREVTLKRSSRFTEQFYPPVVRRRWLSASEYKILKNILEATEFVRAEERYGCPDCYKQGAERLEVATPELDLKVEMDYNAVPAPLESLLNFLRKLWARVDNRYLVEDEKTPDGRSLP